MPATPQTLFFSPKHTFKYYDNCRFSLVPLVRKKFFLVTFTLKRESGPTTTEVARQELFKAVDAFQLKSADAGYDMPGLSIRPRPKKK